MRYKSRRTKKLNEKITIAEAEEIVIRRKIVEGVRSTTIRNYKKMFGHYKNFFDEDEDIKKATEIDAKDFIYYLKEQDILNSTINSYLQFSKSAFKTLEEEGICKNIFANVKRLKVDEKPIEILTLPEIKAFLKTMDKNTFHEFRDYVLIHVLLDTLGRINETLHLRVSDVDFDAKTVTFLKTKSRTPRTIPVSKKTILLIQELINENEDFETEFIHYIFLSHSGKPLFRSTREASTKLKTYAERAGIKKRVHFHMFRHSASYQFLKETKNIRLLQKILGHSHISITERYAHVLDQDVIDGLRGHSLVNKLIDTRKTKRTKQGGVSK